MNEQLYSQSVKRSKTSIEEVDTVVLKMKLERTGGPVLMDNDDDDPVKLNFSIIFNLFCKDAIQTFS